MNQNQITDGDEEPIIKKEAKVSEEHQMLIYSSTCSGNVTTAVNSRLNGPKDT